MLHKSLDTLTIASTARRPSRRVLCPLCTESTAVARTQSLTETAVKPAMRNFVYAVKGELRSPAVGHPLVVPPSLAVDEVYRSKERAVAKMREVANAEMALEIARGRQDPHSPARLNAVPSDPKADSIQVTRADGMILRYFVDWMPSA